MATKKTTTKTTKTTKTPTAPKTTKTPTAPRSRKVTSSTGPNTAERRSAARLTRPRVLVTSGASDLGRVLCRRLHRDFDVISIDTRAFPDRPKDVDHHEIDLRRKAAQALIKKSKPELVVHIGPMHDERPGRSRGSGLLEATATLLKLVEEVGAKKLVVLSAATLYGPSAVSAAFMSEDAALLGGQRHPRMADAIAVDMMVQSFFWKSPGTETVILRPVHIIGPHMQNLVSRYLRMLRVPTLLGFDPMVQLVHEDDLTDAVVKALADGVRGVFNITGPTQAPLSRVLAVRGSHTIPVPGPLLAAALSRMGALRLTRVSDDELVHLKYACLVDGKRAQTVMGFAARRGLQDALRDM